MIPKSMILTGLYKTSDATWPPVLEHLCYQYYNVPLELAEFLKQGQYY